MTGSLADNVAIVTGGAVGIGAHYSRALAGEGASVVVADIAPGDEIVGAVRAAGGRARAVVTDVSDESSVRSLIADVRGQEGRVDVLVNNAALFATLGPTPFTAIDVEQWDRVMAVNLRGPFLMCKYVAPLMVEQGRGKIINIGSGTTLKGMPMLLHYVASKGGVVALTRTLARELGPHNICVNTLAPGLTLSETLIEQQPQFVAAAREPAARMRSIQRDQVPEDLIGALLFLASPASDFVTGQTILVDGGQLNT